MNILIIEDEKLTAKDLKKAIMQLEPDAIVKDIVSSVEEGKEYLLKHKNIDLIFSDIQLGDGLSFEIFGSLKTEIPIIFVTAYNEYALQAFKSFGIDYILKPFSKETVSAALNKYSKLFFRQKSIEIRDYSLFFEEIKNHFQPVSKPSIILHHRGRIIPIEGEKIALFYVEHELVYAITFDQKKIATNYKLEALEKIFSPQFYRANRQYLINRRAVKEASQYFHRKLQVHLTIPLSDIILVGKEKVTSFLDWLSNR